MDWAHLPQDLLQKIASHLPHLSDHLRFRSVCSVFLSASTSKSLPSFPPFLLLPPAFLSLFESKSYHLPPFPQNSRLFPFPDGSIALLSPPSPSNSLRSVSLTNLLSTSSVPLPPLPNRLVRSPEPFRFLKFNHFGNDLVAALCPDGPGIAFCNPGNEPVWRHIDTCSCFPRGDFSYHDGKFFVLNSVSRITSVFDLESGEKVGEVAAVENVKDCDCYVVEWSGRGELLLVLRRERFELFRLEGMRWVGMGGLEGGVMFLDGLHGMCFDAMGFRGNCIYFVDYIGGDGGEEEEVDCGVRVYDIEVERVEQVGGLSTGYSAIDWRRALWVVPTVVGR